MTPEEGAARATQINQKFLTISDHGAMGAIPRQIRACEENGISPIYACELYYNPYQPAIRTGEERKKHVASLTEDEQKRLKKNYHLLAIAHSEQGYSNLVRLSSWGYIYGWGGRPTRPRVNKEMLLSHKEGLIFTSCCYASEIGVTFDTLGEDAAMDKVAEYMAMFGDKFYLEMMMLDFEKQRPYDRFIQKAHAKYHIPIILTQDCFVAGTLVNTQRGLVPIELVLVGDMVFTHKGRFRCVQHHNERSLRDGEKVFGVKTRLGGIVLRATGNHLVEVANFRRKKNVAHLSDRRFKKVEDLNRDDYLLIPKITHDQLFLRDGHREIDLLPILGDKYYDVETDAFVTHRGTDHRSTISVPRRFAITEDFLKILGLYMAEGHAEEGSFQFGFGTHEDEIDTHELVERFFLQFGMSCYRRHEGHGVTLVFSSVIFNRLLKIMCGRGATGKHFPIIPDKESFGLCWSQKQILSILGQYLKGDGWERSEIPSIGVGSCSNRMIFEASQILNSLGIVAVPCLRSPVTRHKNLNANPEQWSSFWVLTFSGTKKLAMDRLMNGEDISVIESKHKPYFVLDDAFAVRFQKLIPLDYSGNVYNLQVEEDETYTANLFSVHNCHYCQAEDSKMQRLMLMVQTGTTIRDVERKLAEVGDAFEIQDAQLWMKSEEELNTMWNTRYSDVIDFDLFQQAKAQTVEICKLAQGVSLDRTNKLPQLPDADQELKEKVKQGVKDRNIPIDMRYLDRLQEELDLICRKGFSSYFLIQKMMTDEARRIGPQLLGWGDGSEAVGPGRGSACGALTCYCLGITDIDPIKHDLLFSRFLSEARGGRTMKIRFSNIDPILPERSGYSGYSVNAGQTWQDGL